MNPWGAFVEFVAVTLFALSQIYGGNIGYAILTLSFLTRLVMLPISVYSAKRVKARQVLLKSLEPKIDRIKKRYAKDSRRQSAALLKLYADHGIKPFDLLSLAANVAQFPVFLALISAIRKGLGKGGSFLWIKDLTKPDILLALIVASITYLSSILNGDPSQPSRAFSILFPAGITLILAWKLASGIGLYWAVSTFVGLIQSVILRKGGPAI